MTIIKKIKDYYGVYNADDDNENENKYMVGVFGKNDNNKNKKPMIYLFS